MQKQANHFRLESMCPLPLHDIERSFVEQDTKSIASPLSMPAQIHLGRHEKLVNARYSITLSTGKRLVLFRLPTLATTTTRTDNSIDSWTYYAMEAECPHAGGPMGQAQVDIEDTSYVASCPWHAYDFNLDSGESSYGVKACTFPILVQDEELVMHLDDESDHVTMVAFEPISEKVKFKHGARSGKKDDATLSTHQIPDLPGNDATLCEWCVCILNATDPELKIERTTQLFSTFATREQTSNPMPIGANTILPPDEPPRDETLHQVKPWEMPNSGRGGTLKSRIAMLHALANIEQWAIDLAIDICVRFAAFSTSSPSNPQPLPRTFYHDWLKVANDEAKHFSLLRTRLEDLGTHFGALPVHHGLWDSAAQTSTDLRARISVIALVHEARGLDINPMTIEKFRKAGDSESVEALEIIHQDEITHVTTGHRWLSWICEQEGTDPVEVFRGNVMKYFRGAVKGPFNAEARLQAGMDKSYYENLGGAPWKAHVIAGG